MYQLAQSMDFFTYKQAPLHCTNSFCLSLSNLINHIIDHHPSFMKYYRQIVQK